MKKVFLIIFSLASLSAFASYQIQFEEETFIINNQKLTTFLVEKLETPDVIILRTEPKTRYFREALRATSYFIGSIISSDKVKMISTDRYLNVNVKGVYNGEIFETTTCVLEIRPLKNIAILHSCEVKDYYDDGTSLILNYIDWIHSLDDIGDWE